MYPGVFFDKDGTLVDNRMYPAVIPTDRLLPGTAAALRRLDGDYRMFIFSNQPWVAQGKMTETEAVGVFDSVVGQLGTGGVRIHDYMFCPHDRTDGCYCKKPNPGMILALAQKHDIDLKRSFAVGDMKQDIAAGKAAGVGTVKVASAAKDDAELVAEPDYSCNTLGEAVGYILSRR